MFFFYLLILIVNIAGLNDVLRYSSNNVIGRLVGILCDFYHNDIIS